MKWFGESWGAPVCEPETKVDTPVDAWCAWCEAPILKTDQGLMISYFEKMTEGDHTTTFEHGSDAWHLDCFLQNLGIKEKK